MVGILILYALGRVGWGMLTGRWTLSILQGFGLWVLVMVAYVACELFRSRDANK